MQGARLVEADRLNRDLLLCSWSFRMKAVTRDRHRDTSANFHSWEEEAVALVRD